MKYLETKRPMVDPEGSRVAWRSWVSPKQGDGDSRRFLSGLPLFLRGPCVYRSPLPAHGGEAEAAPKQPRARRQPAGAEAAEGMAGPQQPSHGWPAPGTWAQCPGESFTLCPSCRAHG